MKAIWDMVTTEIFANTNNTKETKRNALGNKRLPSFLVLMGLGILLGAPAGAAPHPDFNGDGYADLAVGAPGEDVGVNGADAGMVHVLYGGVGGLSAAQTQAIDWASCTIVGGQGGNQGGLRFGAALAWGDFNSDGYDDLAVGMPGFDAGMYLDGKFIPLPDVGAVEILYGSNNGLITQPVQHLVSTNIGPPLNVNMNAYDHFGAALAAGDFNGDGRCDLAIGVPDQDGSDAGPTIVDAGEVYIIYASANGFKPNAAIQPGLDPTSARGVSQNGNTIAPQAWLDLQDTSEPGDRFGSALAAGDFNGDGRCDLAIGVPYENIGGIVDAGAVNVLYGTSGGLTNVGNQFWSGVNMIGDGAEPGDFCGYALAAGDFNGDGRCDLAIGAPGEDIGAIPNAGVVHVVYGTGVGLSAFGSQFWHQDSPGILDFCEGGDFFGAALAAGDFNGDGKCDLAIGVPYENVGLIQDAGAVHILYGRTGTGLTTFNNQFWHQDSPGILDFCEAGDAFGSRLMVADFNADGRADLAVGVPREGIGAVPDAGAVNVIYGWWSEGLNAGAFPSHPGNQFWHQNSMGIPDACEIGDAFGLG